MPLKDERPDAAQTAYEHALRLYHEGWNDAARAEASEGAARYGESDPERAGGFQLLEAQALWYLGQHKDTLEVLESYAPRNRNGLIEKLTLEAVALERQGQTKDSNQRLDAAVALCRKMDEVACGGVLGARGAIALHNRQMAEARQLYIEALNFAQSHHDPWRQVNAGENLGYIGLQTERFDESLDWSRGTHDLAIANGYTGEAEVTGGNLGFAWYKLGDGERALEQYEQAEKVAVTRGNLGDEVLWLSNAAYVYRDRNDLAQAEILDLKALTLARQMDRPETEAKVLGDVAFLEIAEGKLNDADARLKEALPIVTNGGRDQPSSTFVLMEAELYAARHDYSKAEGLDGQILSNTANPVADRLNAKNDLGQMYEEMGKFAQAERIYKSAIAEWDAARAQLSHEESALSFGANVHQIYQNYVRFLVKRGRTAEALEIADQSRARTLAEGLGLDANHLDGHRETLRPEQIARKADATLLFYWLDEKASYLWAVTPGKTAMFTLPGEAEIAAHVRGYRKSVLDLRDPLEAANADERFLYRSLVAPARGMVDARKPVIVLADGELSELNFETLVVPETDSAKGHYLIEDWTVESAPSLDLLAHGADTRAADGGRLLLVGNPVTADPEFPALSYFGREMKQVAGHFGPEQAAVFEGARATPAAYAGAGPAGYEFIHFVSHATASRIDPLESAILLSSPSAAGGGDPATDYKLYAREIVKYPLNARLVTISACDGAGTRAYAGEGLIGLSWAFLRAGARQVVASLWEVSDDSTPRLMDELYAGIAAGKAPAAALREAKMKLLRAGGQFRLPFYWAEFQIYSRG